MGAVEPPFRSIAIVGLGLIGGSIALAARQRWPSCRITGVDRADVVARVLAAGAIDSGEPDVTRLGRPDLIVLAAPVTQNINLLQDAARAVSTPVVITDVGGTKRPIVAAARDLPAHVTFVGGHPLGGSERGGFESARPDLFAGRPWIFTPERRGSWDPLLKLSPFVAGLGAKPVVLDATEHDRVMAFVSHLPQLTASALMAVVGRVGAANGWLPMAGQGLVDTTRLASSSASVWTDICSSNADAIGPALDLLIQQLQDLRAGLERQEVIDALFGDAAMGRFALMQDRE